MRIEYAPLLAELREVYRRPPGEKRFRAYLHTVLAAGGADVGAVPLVAANPMAKDAAVGLLDDYLALDADRLAADAAARAAAEYPDVPGTYRAGLSLMDDRAGGWTNRWACEHQIRTGGDPGDARFWVVGPLWTSEPATARAAIEAMAVAVHRTAHVIRHGRPRTLRDLMLQEGRVLLAAGCAGPPLDADDVAYSREVIAPCLDATDMRTQVECLFGDAAGATLGFAPRGLSAWAGIAVAVDDARAAGWR